MAKSEGLFAKLYAAGQDVIDAARKPLAERKLRGTFKTAYDNAETQKLESEIKIGDLQADIKSYSLTEVLRLKEQIKDANYTMETIAAHYLEMFGETIG